MPGRRAADAAADVRAIAGELDLGSFSVVGTSGGGPHALACAALMPERVRRVGVIAGVAPHDDPEFDFLAGVTALNTRGYEARRESVETFRAYLAPFVEGMRRSSEAVVDELAPELPPPDRAALSRPEVRRLRIEVDREAVRQGDTGWIEDNLALFSPWGFELASITVPVCLWQGELDVLVPPSHGRYLARKIPGARFELIAGAGHHLDDREPAVLRWLVDG
jgi:pimeloyl-ACP methyl ester carboxylesterase